MQMPIDFDPQQVAVRLAVAAFTGMLIGFERESAHKGVGIRTFSLTSLFGALCALLGGAYALEALGVVAVLTLAIGMRPSSRGPSERDLGLTTAIALVSTNVLGMLIGFGHMFTPVAAAIIITMLLSLAEQFQRITGGVSAAELRSAVLLGLIGFVIYPALPNHTIDRFDLVNPRQVWITVIAVASIGFLNYVLLRLYSRRGLYYAAVLGGLVNSTATIAELATWVRGEGAEPMALGITLSLLTVVAMFLRNFIILGIFSHRSAKLAAVPLLLMGAAAVAAVYWKRPRKGPASGELSLDSPVSLVKVLRFGALFLAIQISGTLAQRFLGSFGFLAVAVIGGTVSSASTAAAAANLAAHGDLTPQLAATGTVLTSITSALINIPLLQRETRRNDLALRLVWITLAIAALGIAAAVSEFKLHLHV
jgi:uncharacterized membrane protein (DUF4010 family)